MERDVGMDSTLFGGPPELGNITKLANSQIGFMNFFGLPLFEGVADVLPDLQYAVDEITINKAVWEARIEQEKRREAMRAEKHRYRSEGTQSPRSASPNRAHFAASPETSHPEGLPASGLSPEDAIVPQRSPTRQSTDLKHLSLLDGNEDFFTPPASPQAGRLGKGSIASGVRVSLPPQVTNHESVPLPNDRDSQGYGLDNVDTSSMINTSAYTPNRHASDPQSGSEHSGLAGSSRSGSQNFSRPYSHQHSAQPSCTATRSSASRAPTFSSANYPTSPAETHATSIGEHSELGSPALPTDTLDRPPTGHSGSVVLGMNGGGISRASRASVSIVNETSSDKAQARARPVTSGAVTRPSHTTRSREGEMPALIKRKSSRWKFDFWRRKKQAERDAQSTGQLPLSATDTS